MPNFHLVLPLQNEGSEVLKICLEPLCEYFKIDPGQRVEIHGIFDGNTKNDRFTIASNDLFLTVYAPGEIAGFVDCYVVSDKGVRLPSLPDGGG